ncbi:MAG: DUF790 family protein [Polyangiaceae bacterium]
MLTVDLLRLRASGSEIKPVRTKAERALPLAQALLDVFRAAEGTTLEELESEIGAVDVAATDVKVRQGMAKLLKDELSLDAMPSPDAAQLRSQVFAMAAEARRSGRFDRSVVLARAASELGKSVEDVERSLFGDLRGETRVTKVHVPSAEELLRRYDRAQEDALLMRATVVRAEIPKVAPAVFRAIFRKLKFLGLLFRAERKDDSYALTIDGASSLFGPTTRYGVSFVHLLPTLRLAGSVSLTADIRYRNKTYVFRKEEGGAADSAADSATDGLGEVPSTLLRALEKNARSETGEPWQARVCHDVLTGAGGEVLVPDIELRLGDRRAYVEVLSKHDRGAYFRRIEFAAATPLSHPLVLCVPKALRVSPELAKDVAMSVSVVVFHGQPSAWAVTEAARNFFSRPREL